MFIKENSLESFANSKDFSRSKTRVLTKEIADKYLVKPYFDLIDFTSIEDAAGERLSEYRGDLLLDGLTSLSDSAAESLSKLQGGGFSFPA